MVNRAKSLLLAVGLIASSHLAFAAPAQTSQPHSSKDRELRDMEVKVDKSYGEIYAAPFTDMIGPISFQTFARAKSETDRMIDSHYFSYGLALKLEKQKTYGSVFIRPYLRHFPELVRDDSRDFKTTGTINYIHFSRLNGSGYGMQMGWSMGTLNADTSWRPFIAVAGERSQVSVLLFAGDHPEGSAEQVRFKSIMWGFYSVTGIELRPFSDTPWFEVVPRVMLPIATLKDAAPADEKALYQTSRSELDHRVRTGVGLDLAATMLF